MWILIYRFIPTLILVTALLTWILKGPRKKYYAGSMIVCFILAMTSLYFLSYLNVQGLMLTSEVEPEFTEKAKFALSIFLLLSVLPHVLFIVFLIDKFFYKNTEDSNRVFAPNDWKKLKQFMYKIGGFFSNYWPAYIIGGIGSMLYLTWLAEPRNMALSILYACLLLGVSGLNIFLFGVYGSRFRILLFVFLILMSQVGGGIYLFTDSLYPALVYILFFGAACIIGFVYPLWITSFRFEKKPIYYLPILFVLVLISAIGSIYVPIRVSANDIVLRTTDLKGETSINNNTLERNVEQQCFAYQTNNLYDDVSDNSDVKAELESYCSLHLRRFLEDKLNINDKEICLHATLTFWIDQFLNNFYGVRKYAQCRLSSKQPVSKGVNSLIVDIYDVFINLVWFSLFFNVVVSVFSAPQRLLKKLVSLSK